MSDLREKFRAKAQQKNIGRKQVIQESLTQEPQSSPDVGEQKMTPRFVAGQLFDAIPGLAGMTDLVEKGQTQELSGAEKQVLGAYDSMTMGTVGRIASGGQYLRGDDRPAKERREASQKVVQEQSGLLGQIAGAITPGSAMRFMAEGLESAGRMGIQYLGKKATNPRMAKFTQASGTTGWMDRVALGATVGGSTTYAYALAKGKSQEEAFNEAKWGAGLGAGANMFIDGFKALMRTDAFKQAYLSSDELVANRLTKAIELDLRNRFGKEFTENAMKGGLLDVDTIVNTLDPKAQNLLDAMPTVLAKQAATLTRQASNDLDVKEVVQDLLTWTQNRLASGRPDFTKAVKERLGAPELANIDQVRLRGTQIKEELRPQYDLALQNVSPNFINSNGDIIDIPVKYINQLIDDAFVGTKVNEVKGVRDHLKAIADEYTKISGGRNRLETLNPQQFKEYIEALDNYLYSGKLPPIKGKFDERTFDKKILKLYAGPARQKIKSLFHEYVPDTMALDMQYSTAARMEGAYEAGQQAAKAKTGNKDKLDVFEAIFDRSAPEQAAFADGVKAEVFTAIKNKTPKKAAEWLGDPERSKLLATYIGDEGVADLQSAAGRYMMAAKAEKEILDQGTNILQKTPEERGALSQVFDTGVATTGAVSRSISNAAAIGATSRLAKDVGRSGANYNTNAATLTQMMLDDPTSALNNINKRLNQQRPQGAAAPVSIPIITDELTGPQ